MFLFIHIHHIIINLATLKNRNAPLIYSNSRAIVEKSGYKKSAHSCKIASLCDFKK